MDRPTRHDRIAGKRMMAGTVRLDAGVDMTPTVETKPKQRDGNPGTPKTGDKRVTNGTEGWAWRGRSKDHERGNGPLPPQSGTLLLQRPSLQNQFPWQS